MSRLMKKISCLFMAAVTIISLNSSVMASSKFEKLEKGAIGLANADTFNVEGDIKLKTKYGIVPISVPIKFTGSVERGDDPKVSIDGYYKFLTKKNDFSIYAAQNYYDINYGKLYVSLPFSKFSSEFHNSISSIDLIDASDIVARLLNSDVIDKIQIKQENNSSTYTYKSDDSDIAALNDLIEGKSSTPYELSALEENITVDDKDNITNFFGTIKFTSFHKLSNASLDFNIKFTNYNKPVNIVEPENSDEYTDSAPSLNDLIKSLLPF